MLFQDSALLDRIFRVFDTNDDNQICFTEYISCLSTISSKASKEEKLKCKYLNLSSQHNPTFFFFCTVSFQIYDFDGDSFISVTDLTAVVAATLREHKIVIMRSDIDQIVASTFEEAKPKHPGMISFDE
jgi:Ca2+-binding EF-hand superfamily protein